MKKDLLVDIIFLSLFTGFGALLWLLYKQVPMSFPHQFMTAPLLLLLGASLLYYSSVQLANSLGVVAQGLSDAIYRVGGTLPGAMLLDRRHENRGLPTGSAGHPIQERRHSMMT
ncbi:hypothetical protein [Aestuariirhabdus litorea]|uniref:Uncharacterized protein n=1 Tax=Aestuariirhabdus litorea TaxID=2528527 RepID=A0A3P3VN32_9GAMM|nr:hypothetical protein [Aestuariirhabdus litorea]RRJ83747.1 hypothetical protein D0544_01090 [Aestuariirhabdus litorea]RWW96970.1 hypothetical protein DZC74_01090 [Endozoicomonadaceae bacterium GTF-13]